MLGITVRLEVSNMELKKINLESVLLTIENKDQLSRSYHTQNWEKKKCCPRKCRNQGRQGTKWRDEVRAFARERWRILTLENVGKCL